MNKRKIYYFLLLTFSYTLVFYKVIHHQISNEISILADTIQVQQKWHGQITDNYSIGIIIESFLKHKNVVSIDRVYVHDKENNPFSKMINNETFFNLLSIKLKNTIITSNRTIIINGHFPPQMVIKGLLIASILAIVTLAILIFVQNSIKKSKENEIILRKEEVMRQVAHDIKSPLSVINATQTDNMVLQHAIERMNNIAADLLGHRLNKVKNIFEITNQLVQEKRLEHPETVFNLIIKEKKSYISDSILLSRVLSNLLNNAAEAGTEITVIVDATSLIIQDNGPGIPTEVLNGLYQGIGITTKKHGHGMGLIHAKNETEKMGASFNIDTSFNGTKIKLSWPSNQKSVALLIEDDALIRRMWEIEAQNSGVQLYSTDNFKTALQILKDLPLNTSIFIDENLSAIEKGSILAKDIASLGYKNIYLCTGYDADEFKSLKYLKGILGKDYPAHILNAVVL